MRIDSPHDGVAAAFRQGIMAGINTLASRLVCGLLQADTRQLQKYLVGFLIALGIALRLVQYSADRSFCYDEAALAVNIVQRTYAELLQPLDFDQGAPLGFLAIQKTVSQWLGNSDWALRLVPLLCGIASVILCYGAARCFAAPWLRLFFWPSLS